MPLFSQVTSVEISIIGTVVSSLARVVGESNTKVKDAKESSGDFRSLTVTVAVRKVGFVVLGDTALRCREVAHVPLFKVSVRSFNCSAAVTPFSSNMRLAFCVAAYARDGPKKVWETIVTPWHATFTVEAARGGNVNAQLVARDKINVKVTDTFVKCCGSGDACLGTYQSRQRAKVGTPSGEHCLIVSSCRYLRLRGCIFDFSNE